MLGDADPTLPVLDHNYLDACLQMFWVSEFFVQEVHSDQVLVNQKWNVSSELLTQVEGFLEANNQPENSAFIMTRKIPVIKSAIKIDTLMCFQFIKC